MMTVPMTLIGVARALDWDGVAAAPLSHHVFGAVAAVVAPLSPAASEHHRLVITACRLGAFLPARAGQVWTPNQAAEWQAPHRQHALLAQLEQVAGCVEITVQLTAHAAPDAEPESRNGKLYLRQRQSVLSATAAAEATLHQLADRMVQHAPGMRASARLPMPCADGVQLMLALLVPRGEVAAMLPRIDALSQAAEPGLGVRVDGPWPPYHFAGAVPATFAGQDGAIAA